VPLFKERNSVVEEHNQKGKVLMIKKAYKLKRNTYYKEHFTVSKKQNKKILSFY
jgi:hypothetical protein